MQWDELNPKFVLEFSDLATGLAQYEELVSMVGRNAMAKHCLGIRQKLFGNKWHVPMRLIGGNSRANLELPPNSFGSEIGPLLREFFDSDTTDASLEILEKAYVSSPQITQFDVTLNTLLQDRVSKRRAPEVQNLRVHRRRVPLVEESIRLSLGLEPKIRDPFVLILGQVGSGVSNQQKWDTFVKERSGGNGRVLGLPEQAVVAFALG